MKLFDEVGRNHEEFKLGLHKDLEVELAEIDVRKQVAKEQAYVVGAALKTANIDIVGGEGVFIEKIMNSVTGGKSVDRVVDNSKVLGDVKETFFDGNPKEFKTRLGEFVDQFGLTTEGIKNLTVAALITKLIGMTDDKTSLLALKGLATAAKKLGLDEKSYSSFFPAKRR